MFGAALRPGEELLDLLDHRIGVSDVREVVLPRELDELRTGDVVGEVVAVPGTDVAAVDAMEDQRGHLDQRKDRSYVGQRADRVHCLRDPRPCGPFTRGAPPGAELRIARDARRHQGEVIEVVTTLAGVRDCRDETLDEVPWDPTGVVVVTDQPTPAVHQHQRRDPFRIRRAQEHRNVPTRTDAEQGRTRRAHGVEHGNRVLHPQLDARHRPTRERVGEPDAARIEPDQSTERREPAVEARPMGLVVAVNPDAAAVAEPEKVDRPVADHVVPDVQIATLRVVAFGAPHHGERTTSARDLLQPEPSTQ